jgi:hypothetical protein
MTSGEPPTMFKEQVPPCEVKQGEKAVSVAERSCGGSCGL